MIFRADARFKKGKVVGEKVGNFILEDMGSIIGKSDTRFEINRDYFHEVIVETFEVSFDERKTWFPLDAVAEIVNKSKNK